MDTSISVVDMMAIVTSFVTFVALCVTIYQARLTRKGLAETRKSIDQEKMNRQISMLPKFDWIIQVDVELNQWQKELKKRSARLKEAMEKKDSTILEELSKSRTNRPSDLRLSKYEYDHMPDWLAQLWLSGAQYYYDAMASMQALYKDGKAEFGLAELLLQRSVECSHSISELRGYIADMVPDVILETPASVNNAEFFRDS